MFAGQAEIQKYMKESAKRHGVLPKIRLKTPLREARWDEAQAVWHAVAGDGMRIDARVLVSGMGALHVPKYPDIPGLDRFAGPSFHSAAWDFSVDLEGRNVAVIGTGASSIQFVPQIAPRAAKLVLFQRTPPWIMPKPDIAINEKWQRRFRRIPGAMRLFRSLLFFGLEARVFGFLGNKWMRKQGETQARRHLEQAVPDPKLRAALTPDYEFGCKRVLISNDFYPIFSRPNVELVTESIAGIREHSIVSSDGIERPVDVLIFGTGFQVTEMPQGAILFGRGGVALCEHWRDRVSAYLGITVNQFPNLFLLLGPNTGLGHNSVVLMIEAQVRYVMNCLRLMRKLGKPVMEVRDTAQQSFVEGLRRRLAGTVWESGGCRSWYQDQRTGESPVIWPGSVIAYRRSTRRALAGDYEFRAS